MIKKLLVNAIIGAGIPSYEFAEDWTRAGFMEFCGNQYNEDWRWKRNKLEALDKGMLLGIYQSVAK